MPINIIQGGPIPNYHAPTNTQRDSSQDVIAQLDYADIWRGPGTLHDDGVMRLDMQGIIPGPPQMQNLQVQVDGLQGNSTVAHANVSVSIQTNDPINQVGAKNKVISALNQSLDSGHSYTVTGAIP